MFPFDDFIIRPLGRPGRITNGLLYRCVANIVWKILLLPRVNRQKIDWDTIFSVSEAQANIKKQPLDVAYRCSH